MCSVSPSTATFHGVTITEARGPDSAGVNVYSTGDTNLDGLSCKDFMSVCFCSMS